MKKLTEQKGFTVAELLIVVAIVAVLVAIALPTFTAQLASAKEAVDDANCRSAQAAATTVCLTDCHGDFSKKTIDEWIQIALADGIPKNGQADPTSTLNCQIESNNHLIKFFYGEGAGTSGPTPDTPGTDPSTPDNPSVPDVPTDPDTPDVDLGGGNMTVIDNNGVTHTIGSKKWNGAYGTMQQGSVYSDETGFYVFKSQTYVDQGSTKPLSNMWEVCRINPSPQFLTADNIMNGQWTSAPKKGDLFYSQGAYYVFTEDVGINDIYPGHRVLIDDLYILA